ncbi:MAG: hypothetical protein RL748_4370 [Pseudomonadota bacterium]
MSDGDLQQFQAYLLNNPQSEGKINKTGGSPEDSFGWFEPPEMRQSWRYLLNCDPLPLEVTAVYNDLPKIATTPTHTSAHAFSICPRVEQLLAPNYVQISMVAGHC